ncbi:MAG TPA: CPBP family intramembrane glutamic endopeptidase [Bacteroidia bacterium]|jgi:membrane protease YdiL (CAAX protease family)|nr:CPBP family intramembrane glutamic endopeptidase [Bacteroidia bacterium]
MPPCPNCNSEQDEKARFCSSCGKPLVTRDVVEEMRKDSHQRFSLQRIFLLYGILLLICVILKFTKVEPTWKVMSFVGILISLVIFIFTLLEGNQFFQRMFIGKYRWWMFPLIILAAIAFSVVVDVIANELSRLNNDVFYTYMYGDTDHPVLWSIISIAVQPAIFEELAFRGIIYDRLSPTMDISAVIVVSSILFGILHLSPISLIWLVPIALFAAWLRKKNGHIVYGMLFHFTYNLCFVLRDAYDRGMIFNKNHIIWIH